MYPLWDIGGGKDPLIKCALKAQDYGFTDANKMLVGTKISQQWWHISLLVLVGVENHIRHESLKFYMKRAVKDKANSRPRARYKRWSLSILLWWYIGWKNRRFVCWKKVHFLNLWSHCHTQWRALFSTKFYQEKIEHRDVNPYIDRVLSKFGFVN